MGWIETHVLLPNAITQTLIDEICSVLDRLGGRQEIRTLSRPMPDAAIDFRVLDTAPIGGQFRETGLEFALPMTAHWWWDRPAFFDCLQDPAETSRHVDRVEDHFGIRPASWLGVTANTTSHDAHQVLGELTLYLADRHDGLICYETRLWPWWDLSKIPQGDPRHRCEELIARMPGRLLEVGGRHIGDVEFARAWLRSPVFHM
jgi:hypothetical protein